MTWELASRRFDKTWFDTKNDWPLHPTSTYICPRCSASTALTRADLERAIDRRTRNPELAYLAGLKEACIWVWRDWFDTVCPFRCSGCHRLVLLGFQVSAYRRSGHMYRLEIVGEDVEAGTHEA